MEENGRVRRGYFVDGLGGAQFSLPGVVDRLRLAASHSTHPTESAADNAVIALAATDPANPYGWLLPWPPSGGDAGPRRAIGATLLLRNGIPVLFIDRGGKRLVCFDAAAEPSIAAEAARALTAVARRQRGRTLRIQTIDGQPARRSPWMATLIEAGFYADAKSVVLEVN